MKLNDHFTATLQTLLMTQRFETHQVDNKKVLSLYDLLATKQGIDEFYKIIHQFYYHIYNMKDSQYLSEEQIKTAPNILSKKQPSSSSTNSKHFNELQHSNVSQFSHLSFDPNANQLELNQYSFLAIMNEVFENFVEFQATEVFMMFQINEKVTLKDLYLIVCMFISQTSNQGLEFFYQFGDLIFQSLQQYNKRILGLTLKVFSKIFGVDARRVTKIFKSLNMKPSEDYNYEDFEIYCFALCNNDQTQGQGQTHSRFTKQQFVSKNHDMNSPVLQQVLATCDSSYSQQEQNQPYWSYQNPNQTLTNNNKQQYQNVHLKPADGFSRQKASQK